MQVISAEEVKKRMDNKETLHLVDVREPYEHEEFNIGGVLIPLKKIQSMEIDELESLKDQEVICYCRSGNRSGQACLLLETAGFSNVKNLAGGMLGWQENFVK
ncbi:MAG: NADH oxidase [Sphingobacteriales bacterium 44-15]|nr:MAG: NADH oxidase [Sphingobacteriales bacterium 44-15]